MENLFTVFLHPGSGATLTGVEYLVRVAWSLIGLGGLAALVYGVASLHAAVRAAIAGSRRGGPDDG